MKVGDKLPIDIQGITVGYAEVKGMDIKESQVVLEVPGLYVTMGLATSLTEGPTGESNTDRRLEVEKPVAEDKPENSTTTNTETTTLDPDVKAESESSDKPAPVEDKPAADKPVEDKPVDAGTEA